MAECRAEQLDLQELLENSDVPLPEIRKKIRRYQIHQINCGRKYHGEYHHLFPLLKMYPDKFKQYMRMRPSTFQYLLLETKHALTKNWCNLHTQPILEEERLVLTLRFLATGNSYTQLAFAFRMGISTVSSVIEETMDVIWTKLQPIHMPVPTEDDLAEIATRFNDKWNFPHCIGAIDGRHVRLKKPAKSGSLYYNYKKFFSVVLQAAVDADYKYITIDVGGYGHQSDGGTFKASKLYKALVTKKIKIPEEDELPNSTIILPYCFIADGAYPLMENLMKPFPQRNLDNRKKCFNKRLARARAVVENAFGYTCQKWQIFFTTIQKSPKIVIGIVKCTCLLHNILIDLEKENIPATLTTRSVPIVSYSRPTQQTDFTIGQGKEVHEDFSSYFVENPLN